jgi:dolichol-phosphate mannosyltransferase
VTVGSAELTLGVPRAWDREADVRYWAVGIVLFSVVLRLICGARIELLPEESYYWNYSRHLDIGYLDHPPMVAWLIRAGTSLFGTTALGVRISALCCGLVAAFFCHRLTRNLFGATAAWVALILMQTLPYFFMSGMLMTPDAPLAASWAAFLYFIERAIRGPSARTWLWAGLSLGLGLLSKYTIVLAALATVIYVAATPVYRPWLKRFEPYAAAALALAIFSPVIFWNAEHEWASFAFQTVRRVAERPQFSLHKLLGSALVLIGPVGLLTVIAMLAEPRTAAPAAAVPSWVAGRRFVVYVVGVPLCVFAVFSLRHQVRIDWTGAPWVGAVPLMALAVVAWRRRAVGKFRARLLAAWPWSTALLLVLYSGVFYHLAVGIPGIGYSSQMELAPVGWRELGRQVGVIAHGIAPPGAEKVLIVGMDRYETASELAFYSTDPRNAVAQTSAGHLFGGVGLMYERWFPAAQTSAANLLLVSWNARDLSDDRLAPFAERLGPLSSGTLLRNGRFIRAYYYRAGYAYRPPATTQPNRE